MRSLCIFWSHAEVDEAQRIDRVLKFKKSQGTHPPVDRRPCYVDRQPQISEDYGKSGSPNQIKLTINRILKISLIEIKERSTTLRERFSMIPHPYASLSPHGLRPPHPSPIDPSDLAISPSLIHHHYHHFSTVTIDSSLHPIIISYLFDSHTSHQSQISFLQGLLTITSYIIIIAAITNIITHHPRRHHHSSPSPFIIIILAASSPPFTPSSLFSPLHSILIELRVLDLRDNSQS